MVRWTLNLGGCALNRCAILTAYSGGTKQQPATRGGGSEVTTAEVYNCNSEFTKPDDASARRETYVSESLLSERVLTVNLQIKRAVSYRMIPDNSCDKHMQIM